MIQRGNYKEISQGLINLLLSRGITPQEIAAATGVTKSFISRIKAGTRSFTLDHLVKLERFVGEPMPLLLMQAVPLDGLSPELKAMYRAATKVFTASKPRKRTIRQKAA